MVKLLSLCSRCNYLEHGGCFSAEPWVAAQTAAKNEIKLADTYKTGMSAKQQVKSVKFKVSSLMSMIWPLVTYLKRLRNINPLNCNHNFHVFCWLEKGPMKRYAVKTKVFINERFYNSDEFCQITRVSCNGSSTRRSTCRPDNISLRGLYKLLHL